MKEGHETSYKRIDYIVRPEKVCILINNQLPHWKYTYRKIIEVNTTLWGGQNVIVVPTDGESISDYNWKIMEAFSPDTLGMYTETLSDLKVYDRPDYDAWLARQSETATAMGQERFNEWLSENEPTVRIRNEDLSENLKKEIYERLRPSAYSPSHVIEHHFTTTTESSWPLTFATQILDIANTPLVEIYETKGHEDDDLDIMESMVAGRLTDKTRQALIDNQIPIKTIPSTMTTGDVLSDVIRRDKANLRLTAAVDEINPDYILKLPYSLSMMNLQRAYKVRPGKQSREGIMIVIGNSLSDVCLANNLSKLQENVYWISDTLLEDAYRAQRRFVGQRENGEDGAQLDERLSSVIEVIHAFASKISFGIQNDKYAELISATLSSSQLRTRNNRLAYLCYTPHAFRNTKIVKTSQLDLSFTPIVMEADNYTSQQAMVFVNRNSVHLLETPKPINFKTITKDLRWITSFTIEDYTAPKLSFSSREIVVDRAAVHETRIDNDSITYLSPGISWFNNMPVDANISKPKVKMIDAFETFEKLFTELDYQSSISDKGMFMRHTIEKFGTLEDTAKWLLIPGVRNLLTKFTAIKQDPENRNERIYLDFSNRAYLDFSQIKRACGHNVDAIALADIWTGNGTLKRGVILQCKRCACAAWYVVGSFDSSFTCQRCGNNEIVRKDNWKMPEEPKWYYSLDEPVHQFFCNHGDVPLLTLEHYRKNSTHFDYVTELKLSKPNGTAEVELDIACIVDGEVVIGEAKSGNLENAHIRPLRKIENALKPIPFKVVFSTAKSTVDQNVKGLIQNDFRNSEILKRSDIYS